MTHDSGRDKRHAHELIDKLDPAQLSAVVPLLRFILLNPVSRSLAAAPTEQERASAEEVAAIGQARASLDLGQGISHEDILRDFGLLSK